MTWQTDDFQNGVFTLICRGGKEVMENSKDFSVLAKGHVSAEL